jgi:5-(carboxyamino)imidazole ribonucleotide synthase
MILPPFTLGLLGGGQLGRMTALAARRMGCSVSVYEPEAGCPAGQVGGREFNGSYDDTDLLTAFAKTCDVVTLEFENIPVPALHAVAAHAPVHPRPDVLGTCQNREREKTFLRNKGYPCADFRVVNNGAELAAAAHELGLPCVLKSAEFGYDGKGQVKITHEGDWDAVWSGFGHPRGVVEQWITFELELSVVCARGLHGDLAAFPAAENIHTHHILDFSIVPGRFSPAVAREAEEIALSIARDLDVVGLLGVEFFLASNGKLLVNELAPRSHNSGHYTLDACVTNQFEQHVRAVAGLPLGSTELLSPVVMVNILGDAWNAGVPDWTEIFQHPKAKLHLYGKATAKPGRKMGHFTVLGSDIGQVLEEARAIKNRLLRV